MNRKSFSQSSGRLPVGKSSLAFLVSAFSLAALAFFGPAVDLSLARSADPPLDQFEAQIKKFEASDKVSMPPPGGTLFIGSSTFTHWKTLESELKEYRAINRGFGGSTIPEINHYEERIGINYKPARIVFYAGSNDIAEGHSAKRILEDFQSFVEKMHKALPDVQIFFISMSVPPCRMQYLDVFSEGNRLVREYATHSPGVHYVDVTPVMHDGNGDLRNDYFLPDKLHMTRAGYDAWLPIIKQALNSSER